MKWSYYMTPNRSYNKTSAANWGCFIKEEFGEIGVVIYDRAHLNQSLKEHSVLALVGDGTVSTTV